MSFKKLIICNTVLAAAAASLIGCSQNSEKKPAAVVHPYSLKEPLKEARVFDTGNISMPNSWESTAAISPDGKEFIFQSGRQGAKPDDVLLYRSRYQDGVWSKPELLPFVNPKAVEGDPALTSDGQTLIFASDRPAPGLSGFNLWKATRTANGEWGEPKAFGPEINATSFQVYPSVAANGNLYFSRDQKLFRSVMKDGSYQKAEPLSQDINGDRITYMGFIDPQERFLLYYTDSGGGMNTDIWVSYQRDGKWTAGEKLNEKVNTDKLELTPYVSPDSKYLFFGRGEATNGNVTDIMQIDLAETGIKLQ